VFWPQIIEDVKKINSPLANTLKSSTLETVSGNSVVLGVKFAFHKQNIENQKSQAAIREVLEKITGKKLAAKAMVVKPDAAAAASAKVNLGDVLQVFGGELIE
jgi:hypothetical protein